MQQIEEAKFFQQLSSDNQIMLPVDNQQQVQSSGMLYTITDLLNTAVPAENLSDLGGSNNIINNFDSIISRMNDIGALTRIFEIAINNAGNNSEPSNEQLRDDSI